MSSILVHFFSPLTFSPFFRAQTDLNASSIPLRLLKMTVYNNLGGTRMETYMTSHRKTVYGDMPIDEALEFEYRIMNYRERGYEELPYYGLIPRLRVPTKRSVPLRAQRAQKPKSGPASTWTFPTWTCASASARRR